MSLFIACPMQKWVVFAIPMDENRTKKAKNMEKRVFTGSKVKKINLSLPVLA